MGVTAVYNENKGNTEKGKKRAHKALETLKIKIKNYPCFLFTNQCCVHPSC